MCVIFLFLNFHYLATSFPKILAGNCSLTHPLDTSLDLRFPPKKKQSNGGSASVATVGKTILSQVHWKVSRQRPLKSKWTV